MKYLVVDSWKDAPVDKMAAAGTSRPFFWGFCGRSHFAFFDNDELRAEKSSGDRRIVELDASDRPVL
jgi:hypothetical protein